MKFKVKEKPERKHKQYASPVAGYGVPGVVPMGPDGKPRVQTNGSMPKKPAIAHFTKDHVGRWVHVGWANSSKTFEIVARILADGTAHTVQPWEYVSGLFGAYNAVGPSRVIAIGEKFEIPDSVLKLKPGTVETGRWTKKQVNERR